MASPLVRTIPPDLVRFFAQPCVAADSLATANDTAAQLQQQGILSTLDLLAGGIDSPAVVEQSSFT